MKESDYDMAFDVFSNCVPSGKDAYAIPMILLTPNLAAKMAAIPDAVCLAKCDKVLERQMSAGFDRMVLKFGDVSFEAKAVMGAVIPSADRNLVVCFTPRVVEFKYVVLDVVGMVEIYEGRDPSDLARDAEDLDWAVSHHDMTT